MPPPIESPIANCPGFSITSPKNGAKITYGEQISILGEANHDNFAYYKVQFRDINTPTDEDSEWHVIGNKDGFKTPVVSAGGFLGTWDPKSEGYPSASGHFLLRLIVGFRADDEVQFVRLEKKCYVHVEITNAAGSQ